MAARRTISRKYAFVIVSLAMFGVALAACRPAVKGYVASTIIEFAPAGAKEGASPTAAAGGAMAVLNSRLLSDAVLADAAAAVSTTGAGSEEHTTLQRYVREGLEVRPAEAPDQFVLSLTGADRLLPVAMLKELTAELAAAESSPADQGNLAAVEELAEARDAAREEVERVQAALADWERRRDAHRAAKPKSAPTSLPPAAPPAPPPRENPEWAELNGALKQLRERRLNLLVDRMPAHPEVQDVQFRIEEVEAQLASIPQFLTPKAPPRKEPQPPPQPERDDQAEYERVAAALAAEGERLERDLQNAQARLTAATAVVEQARSTSAPASGQVVRVIEPAAIVGVVGGVPRGLGLVAIALMAGIIGLVAARRLPGGAELDVFTSTEEIARTLGLPVIAEISTGDGPAIRATAGRGRLIPLGVRLCEIALAGFLLLTVVGAATDSLAGRLLLRSPLHTFALACERFLPL